MIEVSGGFEREFPARHISNFFDYIFELRAFVEDIYQRRSIESILKDLENLVGIFNKLNEIKKLIEDKETPEKIVAKVNELHVLLRKDGCYRYGSLSFTKTRTPEQKIRREKARARYERRYFRDTFAAPTPFNYFEHEEEIK